MTKEEKKEYMKAYREANKEKTKAYNKAWNIANKEKKKAKWNSYNDGLFTVYLLPEENYVGMTSNFYYRLSTHKCKHKRNTEGAKVLGKYKTKKMALYVEAMYHDKGYNGRHPNDKNKQANDPLEAFKKRMEEFNKPEAIARRKEIEQELLLIGKRFNLK